MIIVSVVTLVTCGRLCTQTITESSLHIHTRYAIRSFPISETPMFNNHGSYNLMFSNRGIHKIEGKTCIQHEFLSISGGGYYPTIFSYFYLITASGITVVELFMWTLNLGIGITAFRFIKGERYSFDLWA